MMRYFLALLLLFALVLPTHAQSTASASASWTSPTSAVITWSAPESVETVCLWHDGAPVTCVPASTGQVVLSDEANTDAAAKPVPYHRYGLEFLPNSHPPGPDVFVTLDHRPLTPRAWLPAVR